MLMPEADNSFRATADDLRPLREQGCERICTSPPKDKCLRLLLKKLDKRMFVCDVREELDALHVHVQAAMQLRLRREELSLHTTLPSVGGARP